jgi:hypothetical protein
MQSTVTSKFNRRIWATLAVCLLVAVAGCNRAAVRIPGASLSFPETPTRYVAQKTRPYNAVVLLPIDLRQEHYEEHVAGSRWTGCRTDPFWTTEAPVIIRDRIVTELTASKLFTRVSQAPSEPSDIVIRSEIHAFCSQAVGFLILRVAGISALKITVERNGRVLFQHKFERVVTDADPQYSGSQVGFIEQAMKVTMADSLRELVKDFFARLEREAPVGTLPNPSLQGGRAASGRPPS